MSAASFNELIDLLQPWLQVNCEQSCNASKGKQPIVAELIMHCSLCYLAGEPVHDIRVCTAMSVSSFYRAVRCGIDAINSCPRLAFKFPVQVGDLVKSASKFESLSSHGLINGCIGALDGWLCQIQVPSANEVTWVKSYFSGHYQCYGVNVQATCDAYCQFTSLSVICLGGTSDSKAFYASRVYNLVSHLPGGFFVVADNVYTLSPTLLIPCSGINKLNQSKDAFNFFLSQLHIRIEQGFGLLVMKWHVFKKPLEVKFWQTTLVIEAAFHLHNYCMDKNEYAAMVVRTCDPENFTPRYVEHLDPLGDNPEGSNRKRHVVREALVDKIRSDGQV
jgi:hypothetical protein